jgi:hypothetical protein
MLTFPLFDPVLCPIPSAQNRPYQLRGERFGRLGVLEEVLEGVGMAAFTGSVSAIVAVPTG